jgi:glycosyltransferase involved in cell wall biosynthesis
LSEQPKVSVLTTVYNREKFLPLAIESVLNSTYENFELIVVDDCSSDHSLEIARDYEKRDSRVRVHQNEQNMGDYPNRNIAASYAQGSLLKYLDSDDSIARHGLEIMVDCMRFHPDASFGLCEQALSGPHPQRYTPAESYRINFFESDLFGRAPGSSIVKTDVFLEAGGFSGKRQVGDHELWLRLARKHDLVTMPRDLTWARVHGQQEQKYDDEAQKADLHFQVQKESLLHPDCPLSREEAQCAIERLRQRQALNFWRTLLKTRNWRDARKFRTALDLTWRECLGAVWQRPGRT